MIGLVLLLITKITLAINNESGLNHVAGAWTALAQDLSNGIFYRPLYSEEGGFGGTRFFPLYFSFHAALIKLTGLPITSGHILSLSSGVLLFIFFYLLLRKSNIEKIYALAFVALLLSSTSIQHGLETIRGDILPLALNIVGLYIFLSKLPERYREILTSTFFVLAFSAKITSVAGLIALCLWLHFNGRKKEAIRIFVYTTAGCILFLGFIYYASSTRVYTIFTTCATGGATIKSILNSPINFINGLFSGDKLVVLFLFWSFLIFSNHARNSIKNLSTYFLLVSLLITIMLYGSPGIAANHLVGIAAGSLWYIAESLKHQGAGFKHGTVYMMAFVMFIAILINQPQFKKELENSRTAITSYPKELVSVIKATEGIVISEDPVLLLKANKSPYLLDSFMLRIITRASNELSDNFLDKIKNKEFPTIIFMFNPLTEKHWYKKTHFGQKNIDTILKNYKEKDRYGHFFVYTPDIS
jgi:hypothetical protein